MEIIPSIDLKGGKCVRLRQGVDYDTTVYSSNPVDVARAWVAQGARRLHVVNLDGAFGRTSPNGDVFRAIAEAVDVTLQFGGGLRTPETVMEAFDAGADRAVLGTAAMENPQMLSALIQKYGADNIIVALDGLRGYVATRGWLEVTSETVLEAAERMHGVGVREVLYTDIERDGMMTGPDLKTLESLAKTGLRVIASGGISSKRDVERIRALDVPSIVGVVIGMALYEGKVNLREVL